MRRDGGHWAGHRGGRGRSPAAVAALALLLGGCTVVPDWADPAAWLGPERAAPEKVAAGQADGGERASFPNLASVPDRAPRVTPQARRAEIEASLKADRANAAYTGERLVAAVPSRAATGDSATGDSAPLPQIAVPRTAPARAAASGASAGASTGAAAPAAESDDPGERARRLLGRSAARDLVPPEYRTPEAPATAAGPEPASPAPVSAAGSEPAAPAPEAPALARELRGQQAAAPRAESPPLVAQAVTAPATGPQLVAVIYFGHGSARLSGDDREVLRAVVDLQRDRGGRIRIVGHASAHTGVTDQIGHRMTNFEMSLARAHAVAAELLSLGVAEAAVRAEARGDAQPVYHEFMATGEAGNRRAEVFLEH